MAVVLRDHSERLDLGRVRELLRGCLPDVLDGEARREIARVARRLEALYRHYPRMRKVVALSPEMQELLDKAAGWGFCEG